MQKMLSFMHLLIYLIPICWAFTLCKVLCYTVHVGKDKNIWSSESTCQYNRNVRMRKMKSAEEYNSVM